MHNLSVNFVSDQAQWLKVPLSAWFVHPISDERYYCFVEDELQLPTTQLGIYPCEIDACVFASFERDVYEVHM